MVCDVVMIMLLLPREAVPGFFLSCVPSIHSDDKIVCLILFCLDVGVGVYYLWIL